MTHRPAGWRSARFVARTPQPARHDATAAHQPTPAYAPRLGRMQGLRSAGGGAIADLLRGNWSLAFAAVLAYIFAAVTYALPIVGPSIVIALIGLAFERTGIRFPLFLLIFVLFVAWGGASYTSSYVQTATMDQTIVLAKVVLITFVIVNVTSDSWRIRMFMIFFLACFATYPARGTLVNFFIVGYRWFGRALWNFIYGNSNDLAALTFFPLALSIAVALTEKPGWIRKAALAGCGVLPLIILLTQSRGALIALVATGLIFFTTYSRGKRMRALLGAAAIGVVILPFVPKSAWDRFAGMKALTSTATISNADAEGSAEARYAIWRVARAIVAENPVAGIGLGAYPRAHATYAPRVGVPVAALGFRDTHSTYLNVAAETGLPGLFLFLATIASVAIPTDRVRRLAKGTPRAVQLLALELGLLAFLLAGVFGSFGKLSFLYIQLALMWAIADVTKRELAAGAVGPGARSRRQVAA